MILWNITLPTLFYFIFLILFLFIVNEETSKDIMQRRFVIEYRSYDLHLEYFLRTQRTILNYN